MGMSSFRRMRVQRERMEAYERARAMENAPKETPAEEKPKQGRSHVESAMDMVKLRKSDAEKLKKKN